MRPTISLVSGTYNRLPLLMAMVASFRANIPLGVAYEVVIVDGGSTDGTLDWCKAQRDIVLIEHGELRGAIKAFTEGAFSATGKYVLIANDDIEFKPNSILPAIVHLENNPHCGAVAYKDNREILPYYTKADYKVLTAPGIRKGQQTHLMYAQVGLFRKWLGDKMHWWMGEHDEMAIARTYAGDNCLSAHIWSHGYTVESVPQCIIEDRVAEDELRQIISAGGTNSNDSDTYYTQWKGVVKGPTVPDKPDLTQLDTRAARILYLPIYEPGWPIQHHPVYGKRGLRDALARARNKYGEPCIAVEVDYLSIDPRDLQATLTKYIKDFQPDVILSQIQSATPLTAQMIIHLRTLTPAAWINWNGDVWEGGLTSPEMMQILRHVDMQLVVNANVLPYYEQAGINAAYWQIGFEDVADELLPDMPSHDVVWLASLYNDNRKAIDASLKELNYHCYQPGDDRPTLYDFASSKALYRNAKIALSNNDYPDKTAFVSNRIFQILAAGGLCVLFQQSVHGLTDRTGLLPGTHFIEWRTNEELPTLIAYWLDPAHDVERKQIADAGMAFVREFHSFDARVAELFEFIKTRLGVGKQMVDTVTLKHKGTRGGGGWPSVKGRGYEFTAGGTVTVLKEDAELMLKHSETWELA